jgi:hypothetical protein
MLAKQFIRYLHRISSSLNKTMPKIKTFEDACKFRKLDPKKVLPENSILSQTTPGRRLLAHAKLMIIAKY